MLQKLVGVMNLILFLSCPFNIQGRGPYMISFKKTFNIGLFSDIYRPFSLKLGMIMKTKLYILISVWMTLTIIQGHGCIRNQL